MPVIINHHALSQTLRDTAIHFYKDKELFQKTNISALLWIAADCLSSTYPKNFNLTHKEFIQEKKENPNQYEFDFNNTPDQNAQNHTQKQEDSNILIIADDIDNDKDQNTNQYLLAENERMKGTIQSLRKTLKDINNKGTTFSETIECLLNEKTEQASGLNAQTLPEQDFKIHEKINFLVPQNSGETLESAILYVASLIEKRNAFRITRTQISDSALQEMQNALKTLYQRLCAHFDNNG